MKCPDAPFSGVNVKNFPFPRQYATVNYIFVWIFLILLPFGMLNIFTGSADSNSIWLAIPFTMLAGNLNTGLIFLMKEYGKTQFGGWHGKGQVLYILGIQKDLRNILMGEKK